jgi:hypothetical protein
MQLQVHLAPQLPPYSYFSPSNLLLLHNLQVSAAATAMSPATGLFTCLRSYPNNAGEADGARRILTALLGRVAEAMHQVAKRLAALKVRDMACKSLLA